MSPHTFQQAQPHQARAIARLIMEAMNHECCQHFAGPHHTLQEFEDMMTVLVADEHSQYSYRNTLVATTTDGEKELVVGICVSYDGAQLRQLRKAFVRETAARFNRDFSQMDDETQEGELYVDSLAVAEAFRGRGIAKELLRAAAEKARRMGIDKVGLLVDQGNPKAQRLYEAVGFRHENNTAWGGHPMHHLTLTAKE